MQIDLVEVDYRNTRQTDDLFNLLNEYAAEPMGGGASLDEDSKETILAGLRSFPTSFSLLIYADGKPAALANCFFGFSTFAARKLVNIHDLMVSRPFRGKGMSQMLLDRIEKIAIENNCCKMTLEVLSNNHVAQNSYRKFGFAGYELDPTAGEALFWQKKLGE